LSAKGQRWGMPTYNWENIAKDNYRYVKEKLKYAQEFYNILRIDMWLGFFGSGYSYEDKEENQGLNGKFDPLDEHLWCQHGQNIFEGTRRKYKNAALCEDLGVIPKCCTDTLLELVFLEMRCNVGKDWNVRHDFFAAAGVQTALQ